MIVGATVNGTTYAADTTPSWTSADSVQAAQRLDGYVGVPIALAKQRWYLTELQFANGISSLPAGLANLIAAGCGIQLCVKPTRAAAHTGGSTLTAQQHVLSSFLNGATNSITAALTAAGLPKSAVDVTLWTECNGSSWTTGNPGITWQAYWAAYAGIIQSAGYAVCYNPSTNATSYPTGIKYFTGLSPAPDKFYIDWYGTQFKDQIYPDVTPPGQATNYMALADSIGIPFGFAEWGTCAAGATPLSQSDYNDYVTYIIDLSLARIAAGKPNADITYFGTAGTGTDGDGNAIYSATDFKSGNVDGTSGVLQVYQALTGTTPVPPPPTGTEPVTVPFFPPAYGPQFSDFDTWIQRPFAFLTQRVVFRAQLANTATPLPSGVTTLLPFDTVLEDPLNAWDDETFEWLCPDGYSGTYLVSITGAAQPSQDLVTTMHPQAALNGTLQAPMRGIWQPGFQIGVVGGSLPLQLYGGQDTVSGYLFWSSNGNGTVSLLAGRQCSIEISWFSL